MCKVALERYDCGRKESLRLEAWGPNSLYLAKEVGALKAGLIETLCELFALDLVWAGHAALAEYVGPKWGLSWDELIKASHRGEVFSFRLGSHRYVLRELSELNLEGVIALCTGLQRFDQLQKLVFFEGRARATEDALGEIAQAARAAW
jgi:hypothetical protein